MPAHQRSFRVHCPTCGQWAQLRVANGPAGPVVVNLSCRDQTDSQHRAAGPDELADLLREVLVGR